MSDGNNKASDDLALIVGNWKKDNSKKKGVYWVCRQSVLLKRDCSKVNGRNLPSGSK